MDVNTRHREENTQIINNHTTTKVKQPAAYSLAELVLIISALEWTAWLNTRKSFALGSAVAQTQT